jgi:hypothetical protein
VGTTVGTGRTQPEDPLIGQPLRGVSVVVPG